jgi:hypothetical protein
MRLKVTNIKMAKQIDILFILNIATASTGTWPKLREGPSPYLYFFK